MSQFVDFKTIKQSVSIVQILEHYNLMESMKGKGDSLSGVCPIHGGHNKTQFRVSKSKNCWNCFGKCQQGGNIIDFVSLKEGLDIRESALLIAEWFGIKTENTSEKKGKGRSEKKPEKKPLPKETEEKKITVSKENKVLGFNLQNLDIDHPYLLEERGLSKEVIETFGLGYCSKGIMKGRIVIPIHNLEGEKVAYAGRYPGDPPDEGTPKYRLPKGFNKSLELFNSHRAKEAGTSNPLVILEGYFGCFNVWATGHHRIVALMGSSMSPRQYDHIKKLVSPDDHIILILDEDKAGRGGREKIIPELAKLAFVKSISFDQENTSSDDLRQLLA